MLEGPEMTQQTKSAWRLARLRSRHAWLDHLVRAGERYTETHGTHYAAAITYLSVLALVPLLMVAFASVALVLASNPALLARLKAEIGKALPAGLAQTLSPVIDQAITSATTVGAIGLLFALVTGLGWMTNFRDALSVQWGQGRHPPTSYLRRLGSDLASLIGLDLAIVVSFGLTAFVDGGFARQILGPADVVAATPRSPAKWLRCPPGCRRRAVRVRRPRWRRSPGFRTRPPPQARPRRRRRRRTSCFTSSPRFSSTVLIPRVAASSASPTSGHALGIPSLSWVLLEVVTALGLERVVLVGNSMGGPVCVWRLPTALPSAWPGLCSPPAEDQATPHNAGHACRALACPCS
jgi:Virulence factor BrkB